MDEEGTLQDRVKIFDAMFLSFIAIAKKEGSTTFKIKVVLVKNSINLKVEEFKFLQLLLYFSRKIILYTGKKSSRVSFSPISREKAPFYTQNGHF